MYKFKLTDLYYNDDRILKLTKREAIIVNYLLENVNTILSSEQIARGANTSPGYVRNVLGKHNKSLRPLKVIKGEGYMWYQPQNSQEASS